VTSHTYRAGGFRRAEAVTLTPPLVSPCTHRGLLFTVAYEMLGSVADAEDAV
jgi:hypothetical protein